MEQSHARRILKLLLIVAIAIGMSWSLRFSLAGKLPNVKHEDLLIEELPGYLNTDISSDYRELHENRILLLEDPDAVRAAWGEAAAVKQWVRKDQIILGAKFIHNWDKWSAGGNDYDPLPARTQYKSSYAADTYVYHGCWSHERRCDLWNFVARYGQYTVAVRYNHSTDISEKEFEVLVSHVDQHVAGALGLVP